MTLTRTFKRVYGIRPWNRRPVFSASELFLKGGQSNAASQESLNVWDPSGIDSPDDSILEYSLGRTTINPDSPPRGQLFRMGDGPNQDDRNSPVSYPLHVSKARKARFGDSIERQIWLNLAQGGTGFSTGEWLPTGANYQDFVATSNEVTGSLGDDTELRAFIWSNTENEMLAGWSGEDTYAAQKTLIEGLRSEITAASEETPFIFTQPPTNFLKNRPTGVEIDDAMAQLALDMDNVYYLRHRGLQATQDGTHFEAPETRALARMIEQLLYRIGLIREIPGPIFRN